MSKGRWPRSWGLGGSGPVLFGWGNIVHHNCVTLCRDITHSASILLLGNYSLASFNLNPEAGGGTGTVVTDPPVTSGGVITPPH
jgi:hypothetical protein